MTAYVRSADGSRIAYDLHGDGPVVVCVSAAIQFRAFDPATTALAEALAGRGFRVVTYDRRGRGDSERRPPYTLATELADLAALIQEVGSPAGLFGNSSGCAIALAAAAAGLPVSALALWELPLGPEQGTDGAEFLAGLRERIGTGDGASVVEYYMKDMPPHWLAGAKQSPAWPVMVELAPSLEPDAEALAWTQSAPHRELWASIDVPVQILHGKQTLPIMLTAAAALAAGLRDSEVVVVPGANHGWEHEAMVEQLAAFFGA